MNLMVWYPKTVFNINFMAQFRVNTVSIQNSRIQFVNNSVVHFCAFGIYFEPPQIINALIQSIKR